MSAEFEANGPEEVPSMEPVAPGTSEAIPQTPSYNLQAVAQIIAAFRWLSEAPSGGFPWFEEVKDSRVGLNSGVGGDTLGFVPGGNGFPVGLIDVAPSSGEQQ